MFFLKIKKFFKRFWKKHLLIIGIGSLSIAAVAVPITSSYSIQQNVNYNSSTKSNTTSASVVSTNLNSNETVHGLNPNLSSKWINDNKSTNYIQNYLTSMQNYKLNQQSNFATMLQTANGINSKEVKEKQVFDANLAKSAKIISHLSTSQKNQLKNAMLKMYNDVKNKKVSTKNIADVIGQITNSKYKNDVIKYLVNLKQKENTNVQEVNKSDTSVFVNSYNNISLYANNQTIGTTILKLEECTTAFSTLAVAAGLFSIAMFAIAWLTFGSSTGWAVTASIAAAALAGAAACTGISTITLKADANEAPHGWDCAYSVFVDIFSLGTLIFKIIAVLTGLGTTVSATSWAFPAICVVLGMAGVVIGILNY